MLRGKRCEWATGLTGSFRALTQGSTKKADGEIRKKLLEVSYGHQVNTRISLQKGFGNLLARSRAAKYFRSLYVLFGATRVERKREREIVVEKESKRELLRAVASILICRVRWLEFPFQLENQRYRC